MPQYQIICVESMTKTISVEAPSAEAAMMCYEMALEPEAFDDDDVPHWEFVELVQLKPGTPTHLAVNEEGFEIQPTGNE